MPGPLARSLAMILFSLFERWTRFAQMSPRWLKRFAYRLPAGVLQKFSGVPGGRSTPPLKPNEARPRLRFLAFGWPGLYPYPRKHAPKSAKTRFAWASAWRESGRRFR